MLGKTKPSNTTRDAGIQRDTRQRWAWWLPHIALFVTFGALLYSASAGDLWFDEVWSLSTAVRSPSLGAIFSIAHDNNHFVNTLWMKALEYQNSFRLFRLLSILCGLASFVVAGWIAFRKWGQLASFGTLVTLTASYPLILYFSEARGYAGALLFALLAYAVEQAIAKRFAAWKMLLFWVVFALGLGFHSTFLFVPAALLLARVISLALTDSFTAQRGWRLATLYCVPGVVGGIWYWGYWNKIVIGGGPPFTVSGVIAEFLYFSIGLPEGMAWALAGAGLVATALAVYARKEPSSDDFGFFLGLLLLIPVAYVLVRPPLFLHFRYFLMAVPFLCLLSGWAGARCATQRGLLPLLATALLWVGPAFVHAGRIAELLKFHRGGYQGVMAKIWEESADGEVTVSSDHDERNALLVLFYSPPLGAEKSIRYVSGTTEEAQVSDWFIRHTQDNTSEPAPSFRSTAGRDYRLVGDAKSDGVSGWRWLLYRIQEE